MTESDLDRVSPQLVRLVQALDGDDLRSALREVCRNVVQELEISDRRALAALEALEADRIGDVDERRDVHRLGEELDIAAWDTQDRVEAGDASDEEYSRQFALARGASTLEAAFDTNVREAAYRALYEASFALGSTEMLRAILSRRVLHAGENDA